MGATTREDSESLVKCLGFRSFSWMIQFHILSVFQVHSPRPHHVAQSLHCGSFWQVPPDVEDATEE